MAKYTVRVEASFLIEVEADSPDAAESTARETIDMENLDHFVATEIVE